MVSQNTSIQDRIKIVRKKLDIKQFDFAARLGLTQTSMSMIEAEKTNLTDKNIKLICATFNVDENWLRTGNGEMFGSASPYEKELMDIFYRLTTDTQELLLDIAYAMLKRQGKSGKDKEF
ncbi:hypothetical protein FACS189494_03030 [Spirochaetia bacterium]|nr:hypothetical protein FACS189494_03030 [Spirochaetia bacterium]